MTESHDPWWLKLLREIKSSEALVLLSWGFLAAFVLVSLLMCATIKGCMVIHYDYLDKHPQIQQKD